MTRAVYCGCGAQWHGKSVTSEAIADHQRRWRAVEPIADPRAGGYGLSCAEITHAAFRRRFRCGCQACSTRRQVKFAKRKRPERWHVPASLEGMKSG